MGHQQLEARLISLGGYFVLISLAWLMSTDRKAFPWRIVFVGSALQVLLGWAILRTIPGQYLFTQLADGFTAFIASSHFGARSLFGEQLAGEGGLIPIIAFRVLPTIIFVSAVTTMLYYLGVMQWVVQGFAWVMHKLLRVSGGESLSAFANVFLGSIESPLLVRPFLPGMTNSELFAVMVGGFANISVALMAVYAGMDISLKHLLAASVISAPAGLLLAKVMLPETLIPASLGRVDIQPPRVGSTLLEAIAIGTKDGLQLALNVGAMVIVFAGLVYLCDMAVVSLGQALGYSDWHLQRILGYAFMPLAWLIGVPLQDCGYAGELLGTKVVTTEYMAYSQLGQWARDADSDVHLNSRTMMLMTYALCGCSNFVAVGVQIGGLSTMAPERQADIARLALRAMIGGLLASCMTACVAGTLLYR